MMEFMHRHPLAVLVNGTFQFFRAPSPTPVPSSRVCRPSPFCGLSTRHGHHDCCLLSVFCIPPSVVRFLLFGRRLLAASPVWPDHSFVKLSERWAGSNYKLALSSISARFINILTLLFYLLQNYVRFQR